VAGVPDEGRKGGHLRIGELSRRSGVSPELLRAWEERYAVLAPTRTTGGFRLYGEEDEERVARMLQFLGAGIAAAEAARLTLAGPREAGTRVAREPSHARASVGNLQRALDDFDEIAAHAELDRAFSAYGLEAALAEIVLPYLRDLGDRWECGTASIAQEHFASALLRGRLLGLSRGWGGGVGPLAVLACVPGDQHDLGLLCFGLALRRHAWRISYLGPDTPTETVGDAARHLKPDLVVLAASSRTHVLACRHGIADIARESRVALGGAGGSRELADEVGAVYLADDPVSAADAVAWSAGRRQSVPR
jgi:DNA-binding transcriptional MerR regulator